MVSFLMPIDISLTFDKSRAPLLSSIVCLSLFAYLAWQTHLCIYLKGGASMISSLPKCWARYAVVWLGSCKGTGAGVKSKFDEGRERSSSPLYTPTSFSSFKLRLTLSCSQFSASEITNPFQPCSAQASAFPKLPTTSKPILHGPLIL